MPNNSTAERVAKGLLAMAGRKICSQCKVSMPVANFFANASSADGIGSACKPCNNKIVLAFHRKYPDRGRQRKLRNKYGIGNIEYDALFRLQKGCCAICGEPSRTERLVVDHDHHTGLIRGLLHRQCNLFVGWAQDRPDLLHAAIRYLSR